MIYVTNLGFECFPGLNSNILRRASGRYVANRVYSASLPFNQIEHITFGIVLFRPSIYWFSLEEELEPVSVLHKVILPIVGVT
jgi:hypothetical protein